MYYFSAMITKEQRLDREDILQIVENLDRAMAVLRRQQGGKTSMDIYCMSVFSSLRRMLINRALDPGATLPPFPAS